MKAGSGDRMKRYSGIRSTEDLEEQRYLECRAKRPDVWGPIGHGHILPRMWENNQPVPEESVGLCGRQVSRKASFGRHAE